MKPPCKQASCEKLSVRKGLCEGHVRRLQRYGDASYIPPGGGIGRGRKKGTKVVPVRDRIQSHTDNKDGCWVWSGQTDRYGYGLIWVDGRPSLAHRVSYQEHVGPIPEGLELDHLCETPPCVNPDHLEPVTHRENILRAYRSKRRRDPDGHRPIDLTGSAEHGMTSAYAQGCRCEPCISANTERGRKQKRALRSRLKAEPSLAEHGNPSTYSNWGCRCEPCSQAHYAAHTKWLNSREVSQ